MKRIFDSENRKVPRRNERNVFDYGYYKKNVHSIPQWTALLVVALVVAASAVSKYLLFRLPDALTLNDIEHNPTAFIAERAWTDLKTLNDIGPRVSGSYANEVLAVNFLKREINVIQQLANPIQRIYADVQTVTGSLYIDFKPQGLTSVYRNLQNVVVKLAGSSEGKDNHSLLLNCHYDTVPGSPGASDDGGACTVMLEILRVLSKQSVANKHSIIFLFNGAEEAHLLGSHAFITHHKWASGIRAFINIESAGSDGKEVLFQSGPNHPWLVDLYRKSAPHPFGSSVGEEVFQSGIIPSDTDFRVFRDFGNIPGLDLAHIMNGYRYHTKYDHIDYISKSCLQRTGDNVLEVVKRIVNSEQLGDTKGHAAGVNIYFDVLGIVFISYNEKFAIIVNSVVTILALLIPYFTLNRTTNGIHTKYIRKQMLIGLFNNILAVILSAVVCYGVATELDYFDKTMSWYNHKVIAVPLYVIPVVFIFCFVHRFVFKSNNQPFSLSLQIQSRLQGTTIMWSVLLLTTTMYSIRSSFVFLVPIVIILVSNLTIGITGTQNSIRKWLYVHMFYQAVLLLWTTTFYNQLLEVFIPMTGRSGGEKNPDIFIGAVCLVITIYSISFIAPIIGLFNKTKWIFISMLLIFLINRVAIISMTKIGFPYRDDSNGYPTPQRHYISHTVRTIYDENGKEIYSDSGYWLRQLDRNSKATMRSIFSPVMPVLQEENIACQKTIFCGLPVHSMRHLFSTGYWVPASKPIIRDQASLKLNANQLIDRNKRELKFTLTGNMLISIGIQARDGVELIDWDITERLSPPNNYLGKKVYLIAVNNGLNVTPMNFTLTFKIGDEKHTGPVLDIMVASYYWEHHKEHTPQFTQLLKILPSWAYAVPSISSFQSWTY